MIRKANIVDKVRYLVSSPVLLHYTLPVLMVVLVLGTIAQKYIGLYQATKLYFFAPIIWLGPVSLPGMPVILGLIFVNLVAKLVLKSPWAKRHSGIIITHIGAVLLLVGGLLTALFSHEGYMDLSPHQPQNAVSDYHVREVYVFDETGKDIWTGRFGDVVQTRRIDDENLPFNVVVLGACENCQITARAPDPQDVRTYWSMAQHMSLSSKPLEHVNEDNMAGLTLEIQGTPQDQDGVYVVLEHVQKYPEIIVDDKIYSVGVRRQKRPLPFEVELMKFEKEVYPGTDMARAYSSRVRIIDGGTMWESVISMNNPLRYKGYTFYQSSFIDAPDGQVSVLSVVWNVGRSFPYIAGIVMCLGLLVHVFVRRRGA